MICFDCSGKTYWLLDVCLRFYWAGKFHVASFLPLWFDKMSYSNLRKQLQRFKPNLIWLTGIFLAERLIWWRTANENIIEILFKKETKSNNKSLLRRAKDSVRGLDSTLLMVWTGTCDFTNFSQADSVRGCDSPLLMIWSGTSDFTNFSQADRHISINEISVANV